MTSEIRTNSLTSRAGLSTVTLTDSGPMFSGITTFVDNSTFSVGTGGTIHAPATNTLNIGVNNTESLRIDSNSNLKVAGIVTATHFHGDGSNLTGITQTTINNQQDNYVVTATGTANTLRGEPALTFDGATLDIDGGTNDTPLILDTSNTAGSHLRFRKDGSNKHFVGCGGGFSLGDVDDLSLRTVDNIIFGVGTSEKVRIKSTGELIVGTPNLINTSPSKFQVAANDATGSAIFARFNASVYSSYLDFYKSRSNTLGTAYVVNDDDHLGSIRFYGADGSNSGYTTAAEIYGSCDGGSGGSGDMPGRITFHTRPDGAGQAMKERVRIHSNGDISIGDNHTSATQRVDILNGADEDNIVIIRGADTNTEYAAVGVNGGYAVITGGSAGSTNCGIIFRTANSGSESQRLLLSNGGVLHVGDDSVSNTIPSGGLDLQGNETNCVLEMGNPFPNFSGGRVPEFRITTVDATHTVEFRSVWGGTNGLYKHMSMSGGATMFYDGIDTENEVMRITGSSVMVGTTSNSANTQAKGIALNNDGAMISRRDGVMHYYKSIATGGYYANVFMSANTTVGSIFFNSGGTQFNTSSDYRRKENVVSLTDGISKLKQLKPYRFNFKDNPSETVDGFLAHEAQEIVPHTVTGTKDQVSTADDVAVGIATTTGEPIYQQMDLSKLVPLLTASLQELNTKVETLEQENIALRARVTNLEGE